MDEPRVVKARSPTMDDVQPALDHVFGGKSLASWCEANKVSPSHMTEFLYSTPELEVAYGRARAGRSDALAEQGLALSVAAATGGKYQGHAIEPNGARVALDAIKWVAGRMWSKSDPPKRLEVAFVDKSDEELLAEAKRLAAELEAERERGEDPQEGV